MSIAQHRGMPSCNWIRNRCESQAQNFSVTIESILADTYGPQIFQQQGR